MTRSHRSECSSGISSIAPDQAACWPVLSMLWVIHLQSSRTAETSAQASEINSVATLGQLPAPPAASERSQLFFHLPPSFIGVREDKRLSGNGNRTPMFSSPRSQTNLHPPIMSALGCSCSENSAQRPSAKPQAAVRRYSTSPARWPWNRMSGRPANSRGSRKNSTFMPVSQGSLGGERSSSANAVHRKSPEPTAATSHQKASTYTVGYLAFGVSFPNSLRASLRAVTTLIRRGSLSNQPGMRSCHCCASQ